MNINVFSSPYFIRKIKIRGSSKIIFRIRNIKQKNGYSNTVGGEKKENASSTTFLTMPLNIDVTDLKISL